MEANLEFFIMKAVEDASAPSFQLSRTFCNGSVDGLGLEKFNLNDSQLNAVVDCALAMENHSSSIKLLWGPPGTGKTKTISTILWAMLIKGRKTLACAPTNTAVLEVAARIVNLVGKPSDSSVCFLNDIVLFGSKKRMKIDNGNPLSAIFLESRAKRLLPCFMPSTGWIHCLCSLIDLLENSSTKYQLYIEAKGIIQQKRPTNTKQGRSRPITLPVSSPSEDRIIDKVKQYIIPFLHWFCKTEMTPNVSSSAPATKDIYEGTSWQVCNKDFYYGQNDKESEYKDNDCGNEECYKSGEAEEAVIVPSFKHYLRDQYKKLSGNLYDCIKILYNDNPRNPESGRSFQCMLEVLELIKILYALINSDVDDGDICSEELLASKVEDEGDPETWPEKLASVKTNSCNKLKFSLAKSLCVQELRYLCTNLVLPNCYCERSVEQYLLARAKCILCTVSSSFRLYNVPMRYSSSSLCGLPTKPENISLELLIVDEAAQVKECETLIPLQLPGIKQAIFIGDEYQLPALVKSKVSSFNLVLLFDILFLAPEY
jgi:hypothetical protein